MKMFIAVASFMVFNVVAAEHLGDMKRAALDKISRDMNSLEANKTCINGAKSVTDFNNCKYDLGRDIGIQKQESKTIEKKVDKMKMENKMLDQSY